MAIPLSGSTAPHSSRSFRAIWLILGVLTLIPACNNHSEDAVNAYDAPKPDPEPRGKNRILAVILHQAKKDKSWFFKLVGPTPSVDKHEKAFDEFVKSIRFDEKGNPTWTVLPTWKKLSDEETRFAGFQVGPADDDVELTVTGLPVPTDKQLLDNINRWRGQLKRIPVGADDALVFTRPIEIADATGFRVDLSGNGPGRTAMAARPPQPDNKVAPQRSFRFTKPDGWVETQEKKNEMGIQREATFRVTDGESSGEVTVHIMSAPQSLLDNANRWGMQIGIPKMTVEALKPLVRDIFVDGNVGYVVDLVGPEGAGQKRTRAVQLPRNNRVWFFKMTGPATLINKQSEAFDDFVKSVQFEGGR